MKSIKILTLGNSYSNDAYEWLYPILKSAGYTDVVLGHALNGGCNINNHWSNVDEDTENDYGAVYGESVNGARAPEIKSEAMTLRDIYIHAIQKHEWDYVVIQHGPNHVEKRETYSHLRDLLDFIKAHLKSDRTKFLYHMIWKYNDNVNGGSTAQFYDEILDITRNLVLCEPEFVGVIPSVTMRQNMMSSYLTDKDISRDYGHMSLGLGRYALGLLWYAYITGGSIEDVKYRPSLEDVRPVLLEKYSFDGVRAEYLPIVKEAIENALKSPYAITPSRYTGVTTEFEDGGNIAERIAAVGGEQIE